MTDAGQNINCGTTCSHIYVDGTKVTLTATASSGYQFTGWSGGGCSGVSTCTVTVSSDVTVTAVFTKLVTLTLDVVDDDGCQRAAPVLGRTARGVRAGGEDWPVAVSDRAGRAVQAGAIPGIDQ